MAIKFDYINYNVLEKMIHTFTDPENRWLSNFASVNITFRGKIFPSVEHAYMSAKIDDEEWVEFCTSNERTAAQIKKIAEEAVKNSALVKNWDIIKFLVMEECLTNKFNQEPFRTKLIETGRQNIQEGNWWGDVIWGVDLRNTPNIGENHLGRLIMNVRTCLLAHDV